MRHMVALSASPGSLLRRAETRPGAGGDERADGQDPKRMIVMEERVRVSDHLLSSAREAHRSLRTVTVSLVYAPVIVRIRARVHARCLL